MITANENNIKGIVSFGSSPPRSINGNVQMSRTMKKGKIDRGATIAPDSEARRGKEVSGRQINPMAQRISEIRSILELNLPDASIRRPPCNIAAPWNWWTIFYSCEIDFEVFRLRNDEITIPIINPIRVPARIILLRP